MAAGGKGAATCSASTFVPMTPTNCQVSLSPPSLRIFCCALNSQIFLLTFALVGADMSAGHLIIARLRSCKCKGCHCREDWIGWQTNKSGLPPKCFWSSSHAQPALAEHKQVLQPGSRRTHCVPSSEILLQSKANHMKDSSAGQPSFLLPSQESLGAPAPEQVQDKLMLTDFALFFLAWHVVRICLRCIQSVCSGRCQCAENLHNHHAP